VDPVSLTKERERILETKVTRREYFLLVEREEMMITVAVMKSQTKEGCGILKAAGKLICP